MKIAMGIGWKRDPETPGGLVSCEIVDYVAEIERLRAAQDEADALIMELIGLPFPVAYPTGSTKASAMDSWSARCLERGNQQSSNTEK